MIEFIDRSEKQAVIDVLGAAFAEHPMLRARGRARRARLMIRAMLDAFDRAPDATPMAGLAEWHHRGGAGLQLFENSEHAGYGTLTLIVGDLRAEHVRLERAKLNPSPIEPATTTSLVRMNDPDGNLIVLAQPGKA